MMVGTCFVLLLLLSFARSIKLSSSRQDPPASVCLLMMIRDEEHNLNSNLPLWSSLVDCYVIAVDSRTADESVSMFSKHLGFVKPEMRKVIYYEFNGFGYGRNVTLEGARDIPGVTHLIVADPDWRPDLSTVSKADLDFEHDVFTFRIFDRSGTTTRLCNWIFRNIEGVHFTRRLHESIHFPSGVVERRKALAWDIYEVEGAQSWHSGLHGNSRTDARYRFDLQLLREEYSYQPDDPRTLYYLGITTMAEMEASVGTGDYAVTPEMNAKIHNALHFLERRANEDFGPEVLGEETWAANRWAAYNHHFFRHDHASATHYYCRCLQIDPFRADCPIFHSRMLVEDIGFGFRSTDCAGRPADSLGLAWSFASYALRTPYPEDRQYCNNFYVYQCYVPLQAARALALLLEAKAQRRSPPPALDMDKLLLAWKLLDAADQQCFAHNFFGEDPALVTNLRGKLRDTVAATQAGSVTADDIARLADDHACACSVSANVQVGRVAETSCLQTFGMLETDVTASTNYALAHGHAVTRLPTAFPLSEDWQKDQTAVSVGVGEERSSPQREEQEVSTSYGSPVYFSTTATAAAGPSARTLDCPAHVFELPPRAQVAQFIGPSHLPDINHFVFGGRRRWRQDGRLFRVLFASGGTVESISMLAAQLVTVGATFEIVYLDKNSDALEAARALADACGLPNVTVVHASIDDIIHPSPAHPMLPTHLGLFDYIDCSGLLHFTREPRESLWALSSLLRPGGGIGVVAFAPLAHERVIDSVRKIMRIAIPLLENGRRETQIQFLRDILLRRNDEIAFGDAIVSTMATLDDDTLHDVFIDAVADNAPFCVTELVNLVEGAGLELIDFAGRTMYEPASFLSAPEPFGDPVLLEPAVGLQREERYAYGELLFGGHVYHEFYLRKPDVHLSGGARRPRATIGSLGSAAAVPVPRNRRKLEELLLEGEAALLEAAPLGKPAWVQYSADTDFKPLWLEWDPVYSHALPLIDGNRSAAEIADVARKSLWRQGDVAVPSAAEMSSRFAVLFEWCEGMGWAVLRHIDSEDVSEGPATVAPTATVAERGGRDLRPVDSEEKCKNGATPLPDPKSCGRGGTRGVCPEDSSCVIAKDDRWAVCCPTEDGVGAVKRPTRVGLSDLKKDGSRDVSFAHGHQAFNIMSKSVNRGNSGGGGRGESEVPTTTATSSGFAFTYGRQAFDDVFGAVAGALAQAHLTPTAGTCPAVRLISNGRDEFSLETDEGVIAEGLGFSSEAIGIAQRLASAGCYGAITDMLTPLFWMKRGLTSHVSPSLRMEFKPQSNWAPQHLGMGYDYTTRHKLEHDLEQLEYLLSLGIEVDYLSEVLIPAYRHEVEAAGRIVVNDDEFLVLSDASKVRLEHTYNRAIYAPLFPPLEIPVLNGDKAFFEGIEARYFSSGPGIVFVDDLLTPIALQRLRDVMWQSTVWFETKSAEFGGYLGAYLDQGLHDRIFMKLAHELPRAMPHIFSHHSLEYMWAYKYTSNMSGIPIHADQAAVNCNLWITPSEANLDPSNGGLVVYTTPAPLHWDFHEFNTVSEGSRGMNLLRRSGMANVTVPYRENRMVMFNSNLYHKTDDFTFKAGYTNRRINLTFLYGKRGGDT